MGNRLLNVRLTPEDERLAKALRERGVSLSEIVRRALRETAESLQEARLDPIEFEAEMLRRFPTPEHAGKRERPNTLDRRAVREHIRTKLGR